MAWSIVIPAFLTGPISIMAACFWHAVFAIFNNFSELLLRQFAGFDQIFKLWICFDVMASAAAATKARS